MDLLGGMDFSAGALMASMVVSTIGMGVFIYGKKQTRFPQLAGGLALMLAPSFAGGATGILAVGAVLGLAVWIAVRAGL